MAATYLYGGGETVTVQPQESWDAHCFALGALGPERRLARPGTSACDTLPPQQLFMVIHYYYSLVPFGDQPSKTLVVPAAPGRRDRQGLAGVDRDDTVNLPYTLEYIMKGWCSWGQNAQ